MSRALLYYLHGVKKMHKSFTHKFLKKVPAFEIFNLKETLPVVPVSHGQQHHVYRLVVCV